MKGKYLEEFQVGQEFGSHRRTIIETDVVLFTSRMVLKKPG